jgi:hypothetical protein
VVREKLTADTIAAKLRAGMHNAPAGAVGLWSALAA